MAPSGGITEPNFGDIYTIDITSEGGYNPLIGFDWYNNPIYANCPNTSTDYFCQFGGTSAAAPQVAGIAALILSRRPDLLTGWYTEPGYEEFRYKIADTVMGIIRNSAVDQTGSPGQDTPGYDQYHGYGLANAYNALLAIARGDVNNDGIINLSDLLYLIDFMFESGPYPLPDIRMADCNCSGIVNLTDLLHLRDYQFYGGPPPVTPCYEY